jgi:hypothetical protein
MHAALALIGLAVIAGVCVLSTGAWTPVTLQQQSSTDTLANELSQDAKMLASLDGNSKESYQPQESPQQRKQEKIMMSRFGAVPASWCAPDSPHCEDMAGYHELGLNGEPGHDGA